VNGTDLGAGEHGDGSLGDHGHVDADSVALDHTQALEAVCKLVHSLGQIGIGDQLGGLVHGLWYEYVSDLVLLGPCRMPVYRIVGHIDLAAYKPLGIGWNPTQGLSIGLKPVCIGLGHLIPELDIILAGPGTHLALALEALLLHPGHNIGIFGQILGRLEYSGLLIKNRRCCFLLSQFCNLL